MNPQLQETIDGLKAEGFKVYSATISGTKYIYRNISRAEYRTLQDELAQEAKKYRNASTEEQEDASIEIREQAEERLVLTTIVDPELSQSRLEKLPAGIVTTLSELVMKCSAFGIDVEPEEL
jgi:TPP-dependent 2-oxoacid decarboxylase